MKIVQRIDFNPKQAKYLFRALEEHPGCFTDVWLNTAYGYPKNEVHFRTADYYKELAEQFRAKGIVVSLQLSNTIGHGTYMASRDCSGLVYPDSPVRKLVGHDGSVCDYGFCWNDRYFRDYITTHVRDYVSKVRPSEFWIDDDFRATNHAPVNFGCFCDSCLAAWNSLNSTSFTREELVYEFLHAELSIRDKYIEFIRHNMADFMADICRAVHESCAETVICLQNGENGVYTGPDLAHLFDVMLENTGHVPMFRAGAGAYYDHDPNAFIDKFVTLDFQHSKLPAYVEEKCPEIENTPNTVLGKTMTGTALETSLYLAGGATGITYAMLGSACEDYSFYEKGFSLFAQQRPYWEKLSSVSKRSVHGGITYAHTKKAHLRELSPEENMYSFASEFYDGVSSMHRWGLTFGYEHRENGVSILHPWDAQYMSAEEISDLMGKNVITDGESVEILLNRGFDIGVRLRQLSELESLSLSEIFTDHSVNRVGAESFSCSIFSPRQSKYYAITDIPQNSEPLGYYNGAASEYTDVIIPVRGGARWAVIGYALWKYIVPSYQRDRIINILDYIAPNALASRLISPVQSFVLSRVDKTTGKTLAVSLLNCTIEPQSQIKVLIRNPETKTFTFASQYDGETPLLFEETVDGFVVTIPKLSPWSLGTVFCC